MKPVYFLLLCLALSIQLSFGQAQVGTKEYFNAKMALARQGDANAQIWVGSLYQSGKGVTQDFEEAMRWYLKAADQGYANAHNNIGVMYENGQGVAKDYSEAIKWYLEAANQGLEAAQTNIGYLYFTGHGVTQNYEEAMRWCRKAADQGFARAQKLIGDMYENGKGVTQDFREARRWYLLAANQGNLTAQFSLGWLYHNGLGVSKDYEEAMRWYRMAADQGYAPAQNNIGDMYENGHAVTLDYKEAMRWYVKAADQGNATAQYSIGFLYANGKGVTQNREEAIRWYRKAADQGIEEAIQAIARIDATTSAPKPTLPPNLTIENPEVLGIGKNNILDGRETATITVTLKNSGKGTAYGLQPSLVGTIAGLSAKANAITSIEPGASAAITFRVTAPENLPTGTTELTIDIKEQNKFHPEPLALSISTAPFVPPAPILADYKLADQEFIKLGQQAKVTGIIQNNSRAVAKAVRIMITTPDNVFAASDAVMSLGDMQPNAKANFEFEFTANREFSVKVLSLALKIEESTGRFGAQETLKFNVNTATAGKKVVVIGPSGGTTESPVSPLASLTSDVDKDIPARKGGVVPNRYALIIGNEDYKGNQTGPNAPESNVAFAKADALSFKRYAQNVLGVENDHIIMATDMELNQMKREINRLKELIRLENGQAEVLFFYSGHGLPHPETKKPVLLAIDKTADEAADCLELEWIAKTLTSHPHSRIVMFVDACFSGVGKGQVNLLAKKGTRVRPATNALEGNCIIISSSSADEPSEIYDEQQHGFFTYHLLKALKTNNTAPLTTQALFNQLSTQVQRSVLLKKGTNQTPTIQASPALGNTWEGWTW